MYRLYFKPIHISVCCPQGWPLWFSTVDPVNCISNLLAILMQLSGICNWMESTILQKGYQSNDAFQHSIQYDVMENLLTYFFFNFRLPLSIHHSQREPAHAWTANWFCTQHQPTYEVCISQPIPMQNWQSGQTIPRTCPDHFEISSKIFPPCTVYGSNRSSYGYCKLIGLDWIGLREPLIIRKNNTFTLFYQQLLWIPNF